MASHGNGQVSTYGKETSAGPKPKKLRAAFSTTTKDTSGVERGTNTKAATFYRFDGHEVGVDEALVLQS